MTARIQLKRAPGWRKPEGAIVVTRPGRWGNPYTVTDVMRRYPSLTERQAAAFAVNQFRYDLRAERPGYPSDDEIRAELAGRDLCCWCPLTDDEGERVPCHADVLIEISNRVEATA